MNAWSADGKKVLTSQIEAQGDGGKTTPIVYDFATGRHWRVELDTLFEKFIPAKCYVVYRLQRFDTSGLVLVSAMSTADDREDGTQPCFPESLWRLDFRHKTITRVH